MNWDNLFDERCPLCGSNFVIENGNRTCAAHPVRPFRIKSERFEIILADLRAEKAGAARRSERPHNRSREGYSVVTEEHRKLPRRRTFKGGIISGGAITGMDCIIRNLSDVGALLEVANSSGVPEELKLIIKPETISRVCTVVWRSDTRLGVRFK